MRFGGIAGMARTGFAGPRSAWLAWLVMETLCSACFGRHGSERHDVVGQAWHGTAWEGAAWQAWLVPAAPGQAGLAGTARDHTVPQRTAGTARHGGADL